MLCNADITDTRHTAGMTYIIDLDEQRIATARQIAEGLPERMKDVLARVARGQDRRAIARSLRVELDTVYRYLTEIHARFENPSTSSIIAHLAAAEERFRASNRKGILTHF